MEIKIIRIYLSGSKRIHELYEEKQQALLKQEELRRAVRAQDRQMKGYGRDFEALLREKEALQQELEEKDRMLKNMDGQMDKWERMYMQSEEARKSLGEKLEHALGALELLKERGETPHPSAAQTPSPQGEGKRAADSRPYESNLGQLGQVEGGARA